MTPPRLPLALCLATLLVLHAPGCASRAPAPGWGDDVVLPPTEGVASSDSADLSSGPLTLDRAIRVALRRNPDARAALERIGAAQARLSEAEAAFYPQVSGRLSYLGTDQPAQAFGLLVSQRRFSTTVDVNDPGFTDGFRPEIVVALPVFRGGADWYRREAAQLGIEARQFERAAVHNGLRAAVVSTYYMLLAAGEQATVAEASVTAVQSELRDARVRVAAGTALRSDALSLEVRLARSRDGSLRARNAVERAKAGLRMLLALPADAPVAVAEAPQSAPGSQPTDLIVAIRRAHAHRPELAAVERIVQAHGHRVDQEWGGYLPRVDLFGSYGQDDRGLELSTKRDNWAVGFQVELDVFSGFLTSSRVRGARHRLAEAQAGADRTRLEVEREVTEAVLALREAWERERVNAAAVEAAAEAFRLVRSQYETGGVTVTRLLETEVSWSEARSRVIAARFDVRRAEAELQRATGDWQ